MTKRETTPEPLTGLKDSEEKVAMKFALLASLTDSDETDMDLSSTNEDSPRPRKKRAVKINTATVPPTPKWSNPDPYTVLPPPDDSQAKKTDVVKLIRKARIAASVPAPLVPTDAVTSNQDFISFDVDDAEGSGEVSKTSLGGRDPTFGNRKRTYDGEIKGPSGKTRPMGEFGFDGAILKRWRRPPSESGTPWLDSMEPTLHLGSRSVTPLFGNLSLPNGMTGSTMRFFVSTIGSSPSHTNIS
jgi:non-canonical poly(A) RNA polymerase PAPD5/7